jgi:hypothetical protein
MTGVLFCFMAVRGRSAGCSPAMTRGHGPDVTLTVTGDGFNGTGPMNFEPRDGRIARLRIS